MKSPNILTTEFSLTKTPHPKTKAHLAPFEFHQSRKAAQINQEQKPRQIIFMFTTSRSCYSTSFFSSSETTFPTRWMACSK